MEITEKVWGDIRKICAASFMSSGHFTLSTINEDGSPHSSPVGSLILLSDKTGYYFEKYFNRTVKNIENDPRVCILAVQSGKFYWLRALIRGRFSTGPAVRLYGIAGERRPGTEKELARWHKRIWPLKLTKGYDLLWKDMAHVREITFHSYEPVHVGKMTSGVWDKEGY